MLETRGLVVADPTAAAEFLAHVNYYRLSGYCLAFEQARHQFVKDTTFEQVRRSYDFDLSVRDLLNEALELVEVDFRTCVAHHFGKARGTFGHTQAASFDRGFNHANWLDHFRKEVTRSKERFVIHFQTTYQGFPDLPVWVATEVMSFGCLSTMFSGMESVDQKVIALRYGLQPMILQSCMHHLVYVGNLCAHHARLWDRIWSIKPVMPAGKAWGPAALSDNRRLACTLLLLYRVLRRCPATDTFADAWKLRAETVLADPPAAPNALFHMGMVPSLTANPLWI